MQRRAFIKSAAALPLLAGVSRAESTIPRCRLIPLPDDQVSFQVRNRERLRWHFDPKYPRPFFHPVLGPSGKSLTRMGHPGAPNHDHHRSLWFAHHDVNGADFWSEGKGNTIRQTQWLCYQDGDDEAAMAVRLVWRTDRDLMEQEVVAALRPGARGEMSLELQSRFTAIGDPVTLGQTNFGILGVRVSKSLSGHFGGGTISNSLGNRGEKAIFGEAARWMDYSGPSSTDETGQPVIEGLTLHDHPENPGSPVRWHVREDGWMGPSLCRTGAINVSKEKPLTVRYLLHVHQGPYNPLIAHLKAKAFETLPAFEVIKDARPHRQYLIRRRDAE